MPNLRRKNLICPKLQLKMALVFVATSACFLALMGYLCAWLLTGESFASPSEAARVQERVFPILIQAFVISMAVLIPATLIVGILATFLVAGPLYRFEQFLNAVRRGENPPDCRLRKGDELHDFCELLNEVTQPLRTARDTAVECEVEEAERFTPAA